ncbi:hypothetical protein Tco_1281176, partial [Tanacetum coccineum]
ICYDDDEDYTIAITPVLSTKEAVDSLIMEDEHLNTILATESDEVIKSSVKNLVPIPTEFEGISDDTCDVPVCDDSSTFDALSDHFEILSDFNNDDTSSDDDDFEDIEYASLEEKLLNISRLITNIESLNDNPTPDRVLKSPSLVPISVTDSNSFFEKSDTFFSFSDNSLPEFETFSDHTEETRSGSSTTHANNSLPEYDLFLFEVEPDQGGLTSVFISDNSNDPLLELPESESFHFDPSAPRPPPELPDVEICFNFKPDAPMINNFDELNEDECFDQWGGEINVSQNFEDDDSFTFVIRTFLPFLTYPVDSPLLFSTGSEDTIFDPDISAYYYCWFKIIAVGEKVNAAESLLVVSTEVNGPHGTTQVVTRGTTNDWYEVVGTRYCSYEVAGTRYRSKYEVVAAGQSERDTCHSAYVSTR